MTTAPLPVRPDLRPVLWAAPLAGVLAALVNGAIFLLTQPAFQDVLAGPRQMPFSVVPVLGLSVLGGLGAGIVYALVTRLTRQPNRVFAALALVVLLASFLTPLSIPNAPVAVLLILNLMHVVVYACVMVLVPRRGARA